MTTEELAEVVGGVMRQCVAPILARLAVLEAKALEPQIAELRATVGTVRERVATIEARAPEPGPPGPPGAPGADGLGFEDLTVESDGRRGLTFRCKAGDRVREVGRVELVGLPLPAGRWLEGKSYTYGDVVTHDRCSWLCTKETATMPGTSAGVAFWLQLAARGDRGRDAR